LFEAVLFDMDGLFIDSEPDWHAAETEMMRSYGYDWTPEDQLKCLGGPLLRVTQYMSECLDGARSAEELGVDPYLHAAKLLNVDIENSLIFEDSPTGLTAARASGAFVVGIPHYIEVAEEPRLKIVKSFTDIGDQDLADWYAINRRALGRWS